MKLLRNSYPNRDFGLLVLRLGIGIMFMLHGYPKITGGLETWTAIGGTMKNFGLDFLPGVWGFLAAFAEFFGGILLAAGLFTRVAAFLLLMTMLVATYHHYQAGDGFNGYSHALESAIVFFGLLFTGPGKFSFDEQVFPALRR